MSNRPLREDVLRPAGRMWNSFWNWYERTYTLNISIALGLFLLQIVHLAWLLGAVIIEKLFGAPLFEFTGLWQNLIVLVDYTEIPALLSVSLVYIAAIRKEGEAKDYLYLLLLLSQLLHIFWITDEFVETTFNAGGTVLPLWLAWVAIAIDYLEVPVMIDVFKRFFKAVREHRVTDFLKTDFRED